MGKNQISKTNQTSESNQTLERNEILPIVNLKGEVVGKSNRGECHSQTTKEGREKHLHPVIHLHVFSSDGQLYLQQRALNKRLLPGYWDTAVGGHVSFGEKINDALLREADEEIGIEKFTPQLIDSYFYDSGRECELVYVFRTTYDGPFHWKDGEVIDGRFWSIEALKESIGKNIFTPNLELELTKYVL